MIIQHTEFCHAIKPNHGSSLPRYIVSCTVRKIESEISDSIKTRSSSFGGGSLRIGRIRGSDASPGVAKHSDSADCLTAEILAVTGRKHTVWVVAHGMLEAFILLGFPRLFADKELELDAPRAPRKESKPNGTKPAFSPLSVFDGLPTIIGARCLATGGRIVFLDIRNWLAPLSPGMEANTIAGGDTVAETAANTATNKSSTGSLCDSLYRTFVDLITFVKTNNFGNFRYTAASQSMAAFRHRLMPKKILPHDVPAVKCLERASYFGGRFETWRVGTIREPCYHVDVSSMYPSIMREKKLPWMLDRYEILEDYREDLPASCPSNTVCECLLKTNEAIFPVRTENCVLYPTGAFTTVLSGPEFDIAIRRGHVLRTRSWATFGCRILFDQYVDCLWNLRLKYEADGNDIYATYCKQLLNSLYGKFAQMLPSWQWLPEKLAPAPWRTWREINTVSKECTHFRSVGYDCQKMGTRSEKGGTFTAISSWITAYGRLYMNELRAVAGVENCWNQGADSLIVSEQGYRNLDLGGYVADRQLGMVRVKERADSVTIRHPADYTINGRQITAGRSLSGETDANGVYWQIINLARRSLFAPLKENELLTERREWNQLGNSGGPKSDACGWVGAPVMDVSDIS